MKDNQQTNPWHIEEGEFRPDNQLNSEQIFGLGNGLLSVCGTFEEYCTGNSMPESYMSGIYANKLMNQTEKVDRSNDLFSNLPCWTTLNVWLNAEQLDLARCEIKNFRHTLNMQLGLLERTFEIVSPAGHHIEASVQRFLSLASPELGAIKYSVRSLGFVGHIAFSPLIDGSFNEVYRSAYEPEWNVLQSKTQRDVAHLWIQTRRTNFQVCEAMAFDFFKNNALIKTNPTKIEKQKVAGFSFGIDVKEGDSVCVHKFVAILSSLDYPYQELTAKACGKALKAKSAGWNELLEENNAAWQQKWEKAKITLKGSQANQHEKIRSEFQKLQLNNG
ncbi:MAG: hypothetical protein QM800_09270 [Paludibacter sp.]